MAYKSLYNNIIFIEGQENYIKHLGKVSYTKESFYNNQLKNLDDIKAQLSKKAKMRGGNAIINFTYGQKNTTWLRSLLLLLDDNVNWFAQGEVVVLDESIYNEIIEKLKK